MSSPAKLITIRLSHYCEKARWALDRAGVPYVEEAHIPLVHRIFTTRNKGRTVPLLVVGSNVLVDSPAIVAYADSFGGGDLLYPKDDARRQEVNRWESYFDRELGPHVRRWLYSYLLDRRRLMIDLWSDGVPAIEACMTPIVYPLARRLIRRGYRVTAEDAARSLDAIKTVFSKVGASLEEGNQFLVGEQFTAADLAFASLAAPLLLPPTCPAALPTRNQLPQSLLDGLEEFRTSKAGMFALRLYDQARHDARRGRVTSV
ncbi:MAG: glutathione S-transferase family protein [Steroidobacteraceae bacterium]